MTAATARAPRVPAQKDAGQVCDDSVVAALVASAQGGDQQAWDALIERYAPLIWSICRRYRLGRADADDVGQGSLARAWWTSWTRCAIQPRCPGGLPPPPGWSAGASRARHADRTRLSARSTPRPLPDGLAEAVEQELLADERHAALCEAFTHLPRRKAGQLIAMLVADPPVPLHRDQRQAWRTPSAASARPAAAAWTGCAATPAIAALINAESGSPPARHGYGQLNPCDPHFRVSCPPQPGIMIQSDTYSARRAARRELARRQPGHHAQACWGTARDRHLHHHLHGDRPAVLGQRHRAPGRLLRLAAHRHRELNPDHPEAPGAIPRQAIVEEHYRHTATPITSQSAAARLMDRRRGHPPVFGDLAT